MTAGFKADYQRGMDILYLVSPIFARFAAAMGVPVENPDIPTAMVSWNPTLKQITFNMNPDFITQWSDEEVAAIIAHETYHVLLNHLLEVPDRTNYPHSQVLTQAHECIINDGLPGNVGVTPPGNCMFGTQLFDQDFSDFTTKEGYDFILDFLKENAPEDKSDENQGEGEKTENSGANGSSSGGGSGQPGEKQGDGTPSSGSGEGAKSEDSSDEECDGAGQGEGDADGKQDGTPDMSQAPSTCGGVSISPEDLDAFKAAVKAAVGNAMKGMDPNDLPDALADILAPNFGFGWGASNNKSGEMFAPSTHGMSMNWFRLLARINPTIKSAGRNAVKATWSRPNRKLISSYPKVVLPSYQHNDPKAKGKEKALPTLVTALDLSGSIPRELVNDLVRLVDVVPPTSIVSKPITWDDVVIEWDPETRKVVDGRGTRIEKVYEYALKVKAESGIDPYVVVISDGDFHIPYSVSKELMLERWYWCAIQPRDLSLLTQRTQHLGYAKESHIFLLEDFLK